jgi:hypothetical protein
MLDYAERRDPKVVLWNRLALFFETKAKSGIHGRRHGRDVQNAASVNQPFNFDKVLGAAPGIQRAVSQFADDGSRKQDFFGGLGKESTGLADQHGDSDARVELSPLTEIDALERPLDDLPHFFAVVR